MEILGHTTSGKLIVVVSQEEWDVLRSGTKPLIYDHWQDTEVYQKLCAMSLPGLSWRRLVRDLFQDGSFDGSTSQLRALIREREICVYNKGVGQRGLNTLSRVLKELDESVK